METLVLQQPTMELPSEALDGPVPNGIARNTRRRARPAFTHTAATTYPTCSLSHARRWADWDLMMIGGQACSNTPGAPHCPGQTDVEYRTEMSFWALASSPLIFATDPRK